MKTATRVDQEIDFVEEMCDEDSEIENIENIDISDLENDSEPKIEYVPDNQVITFSRKIYIKEENYGKLGKCGNKAIFDNPQKRGNPFIEQVLHHKDQKLYLHLFFDIDDIKDANEYLELRKWLDSLKPVFGDYAIGGYCNNDTMAAFGFKKIEGAKKYASLHISFYETAVDADELYQFGKKSTKGMWPKIDESIYRVQNPKGEKSVKKHGMRFVLSDKVYGGKDDAKNTKTAGIILDGKPPHTCVYQVWGGERIVPKEEWSKVFTIAEAPEKPKSKNGMIQKNIVKRVNREDDFHAEKDCVIPVDEDVVLEILNNFEPTHSQLEQIGCLLMHSPFDKETVERLLKKWYFQEGTDHQHLDTVDAYLDYYEFECSNRWLFSIIKKIPDAKERQKWYDEFKDEGIDPNIKLDIKDDFVFEKIMVGDYRRPGGNGVNAVRFMNDLKKVCAIFKDGNRCFVALKGLNHLDHNVSVEMMTEKDFIEQFLKNQTLGGYYKNGVYKTIDAYMIYRYSINRLNLVYNNGKEFYSTDPNTFSVFQGYEYEELEDYDENIIAPFLNHIHDNIANGNDEMYNYILNWLAFIFQNPEGKTGTSLVLTGEQGTGKNTFTDTICDLMKRYCVRNLTNFSEIVGKFNSIIENKKLIICNEMGCSDTNMHLDFNSLKSVNTEDQVRVADKFLPGRTIKNTINLIILSNFFDPVKVEDGDRRYAVCEVSEAHKNDWDYFEKIRNGRTEAFYQNLLTFFMKRKLGKIDFTKIPKTDIREALMESSKSPYELFIQDFIRDFKDGISTDKAYSFYKMWATINGYSAREKGIQKNIFGRKMAQWVDAERKREDGGRKRLYKLKESKANHFVDEYADNEEYNKYKQRVQIEFENSKH